MNPLDYKLTEKKNNINRIKKKKKWLQLPQSSVPVSDITQIQQTSIKKTESD